MGHKWLCSCSIVSQQKSHQKEKTKEKKKMTPLILVDQVIYFILELLSKVNSLVYNLLDIHFTFYFLFTFLRQDIFENCHKSLLSTLKIEHLLLHFLSRNNVFRHNWNITVKPVQMTTSIRWKKGLAQVVFNDSISMTQGLDYPVNK